MTVQERLTRALPDLWDWEPVKWSAWTDDLLDVSSFRFHAPIEAWACNQCGSLGKLWVCTGIRPARADLGETRPLRNLYATRCQDCGHDTVTDQRTRETWDLDETDYGPAGSVKPEYAHTTNLTEEPELTTLF